MNSLNIKKVVVVAAGAALLGTAFAGAATTVDSTLGNFVPTLYSNGEPNVQVVVGSTAAVSDAVVAANVAAALANKAYTKTGAVSTGAGTRTAGTTAVVLNVSRPATAVAANEYACTTGLSDNLDNNGCGTGSNALNMSTGKAAYNAGLPQTWKEVSDSDWNVLGPQATVVVTGSSSTSSTQRQYLEVFSKTQYDDQLDSYVGNTMEGMWRTTFSSALPMCADTSKPYSTCDSSDKIDATSAPTTISVLGDPWVVTGAVMTGAAGAISSMTVGKGYLVRKTLKVGESTAVAGTPFSIKVDQVNAPAGSSSLPSCNIVISDATNRTVLKTRDRDSASIKITELGNIYVKVSSIGYSAAAGAINTCEVSAYSDSITLSNSTIEQNLYPNWYAALDSNNRSGTQGLSDLRIYNNNWIYPSTGNIKAKPGDKFTLVNGLTSNTGYALEFRGSDLKPADFDSLTVSEDEGFSATIGGTAGEWDALKFCSQRSDAFRFGTENVKCVNLITKNKTSSGSNSNYTGYVVYQNSSGTWVNATGDTITRTIYNATNGVNLTVGLPLYYYASGGGSDTNVRINVTFDLRCGGGGGPGNECIDSVDGHIYGWNYTRLYVQIPEVTNESTSTVTGSGLWTTYYLFDSAAGAAGNFRDATADGTTTNKNFNYTANAFGIAFNSEVPYCSARGSCIESGGYGASSFTLKYATRLGKGVYVLSKLTGAAASSTSPTVTCTPGTACDIGAGVTVTLPAGAAAAGATGTAIPVNLNTATKPLVVLDSDASATQPLIVVGGPFVNSVAAGMTECGALATGAAGDALVKVEGNKLCVAGFTAGDTKAAGEALIGFLASWSPN